ncbi:DUF5819 family protein [Streptomyces sp. NPDC046831]|uniref:DUF5819 family protein n=1 Tax=Streptomyces sp. NPDC046831 TaxID=3154805 RepID=UPI0033F582AC
MSAPRRGSGPEPHKSVPEPHHEAGTGPHRESLPEPYGEAGAEFPRGSGTESHPKSGTDPGRASVPGPRREPAWPGATRPAGPPPETRTGIAALSPRYRIGAALALAVVAAVACVHLGMLFLHVAPSNTVTKEHGKAVDEWIYPEFEQNWKLFAPNPLQQNIAVQARAQVRRPDGGIRTTGWYDLSAQDGRAIEGNPLPSHTQQNELRRAWDFVAASHGDDNRPAGRRGELAEEYLRRIVVLRLNRVHAAGPGGAVERVQVRSRTTDVPPPAWSDEKVSGTPTYHELPWWPVSADETEGGAR